MIPRKNEVSVQMGGVISTVAMRVDVSSLKQVMSVLTNLYKDPMTAVIREYSTNARDSHIESGKADVPIEVTFPTPINPNFIVRDYGTGLSREQIENVFISYGASTKRNSNDYNGQLGFGCKSAFAICDQFVVAAVKEGIQTIYSLHLDDSSYGAASLLYEGPTEEPNGVTITIPVKESDIQQFVRKAHDFYYTFSEHVTFYQAEKVVHVRNYKKDILFSSQNGKVIIVPKLSIGGVLSGGVLYSYPGLDSGLIVQLDIGDIFFTPSREEIVQDEHSSKTINGLLAGLHEQVYAEIVSGRDKMPTFDFEHFAIKHNKEFNYVQLDTDRNNVRYKTLIGLLYAYSVLYRYNLQMMSDTKRKDLASCSSIEIPLDSLDMVLHMQLDMRGNGSDFINPSFDSFYLAHQPNRAVDVPVVFYEGNSCKYNKVNKISLRSRTVLVDMGDNSKISQTMAAAIRDIYKSNTTFIYFTDALYWSLIEDHETYALDTVVHAGLVFKKLYQQFPSITGNSLKDYYATNIKVERTRTTGVYTFSRSSYGRSGSKLDLIPDLSNLKSDGRYLLIPNTEPDNKSTLKNVDKIMVLRNELNLLGVLVANKSGLSNLKKTSVATISYEEGIAELERKLIKDSIRIATVPFKQSVLKLLLEHSDGEIETGRRAYSMYHPSDYVKKGKRKFLDDLIDEGLKEEFYSYLKGVEQHSEISTLLPETSPVFRPYERINRLIEISPLLASIDVETSISYYMRRLKIEDKDAKDTIAKIIPVHRSVIKSVVDLINTASVNMEDKE